MWGEMPLCTPRARPFKGFNSPTLSQIFNPFNLIKRCTLNDQTGAKRRLIKENKTPRLWSLESISSRLDQISASFKTHKQNKQANNQQNNTNKEGATKISYLAIEKISSQSERPSRPTTTKTTTEKISSVEP